MSSPAIAIVHYSAPPVIGGVEAVMEAHAHLLLEAGYEVTIVAGRGAVEALPLGVNLELVPELDSQHPEIVSLSEVLEQGRVPAGFLPARAMSSRVPRARASSIRQLPE